MDIVKVEWIDSSSDIGRWTLAGEIDNDILHCVSFGILVKETDEQITLALNGSQEPEQYCQMISIPKCAIKKLSHFNTEGL